MPPERDQRTPPPTRRRRPDNVPGGWMWLVLLLLLASILWVFLSQSGGVEVAYSEFFDIIKKNSEWMKEHLKKDVVLSNNKLSADFDEDLSKLKNVPERLKDKLRGKKIWAQVPEAAVKGGRVIDKLSELHSGDLIPGYREQPDNWGWVGTVAIMLLPALLLLAIFFLFLLPRFRDPLGGGFLSNYIKSPARRYEKTKARVTFDDVADMKAAKYELQEVVEFLRSPDKFRRLGAEVPKGVLLIGPPGTGKTLLARACAGEAGVPFYSISGSEFIQMFVGVGASRVRDLFKTAKDNAPCLIFIDEIDAVGRMRGAGVGGGSDEREQTLNQILSEMDGFQPNESVIVIAATNRPDVLDSALLRPGRFDRHVTIDRPTWQGRMAILKVHTRNKPLADDVDLEQISRSMAGMTGADLRNLANEAALLATRENKNRIERSDFERAIDRIMMGPAREEILSDEDKRRTAYHEAGHALVGWLEPECDPPTKITIIPRGQALGVTISMPEEDRYHHGMDYFIARLAQMMGGRAADRLIYNQPFSGHENDLKQATRLARYMVTHWGMNDRLGPMSFRVGEEHVFLGKEIQQARDFSETTASAIDEEVQKLLRMADKHAEELLSAHRDLLDKLVEALLEKEELYGEEIEEILGPSSHSMAHNNHAPKKHDALPVGGNSEKGADMSRGESEG